MNKKAISLLLMFAYLVTGAMALAESTQGTAYGVYSMEGEQPDSLIRVTLTCEDGQIVDAQIDEKLIPYSLGGAEGWGELDEETAALLGDAVFSAGGKAYPANFELGGIVWQGSVDEEGGVVYTAQIGGEEMTLMDYICTDEGGAWYFEQETAGLIGSDGVVATAGIGTKASIEHGVAFWPSELKFPGNIEKIAAFLTANGVDYAMEDVAKGEDGVWNVADVATGATLAGTPNYLLIAKKAYDRAVAQ